MDSASGPGKTPGKSVMTSMRISRRSRRRVGWVELRVGRAVSTGAGSGSGAGAGRVQLGHRAAAVRLVGRGAAKVERQRIHDEATLGGCQLGHDATHRGHEHLAPQAPGDDVDLPGPGAEDLADRAQHLAARGACLQAHDLVPVPGAGRQRRLRHGLQVAVAQRLGRLAAGDLGEVHQKARLGGSRPGHGQGLRPDLPA